jgi:hypothetical protein
MSVTSFFTPTASRVPTRRLVRAAAVAAVLAVPVAGALPASAAVAPADRVHASDLPTVGEVSRIYPAVAGGHREVMAGRDTMRRSADCMGWENGPDAASGRWAYYTDAGGQSPYFSGKADPVVFVWKFHTVAGAKRGFASEWNASRDCAGTHTFEDSTVVTQVVTVPDLGSRSQAWRDAESSSSGEDHFLTQLTRRGRYLVETRVQAPGFVPAKAPLVDLTRATLARLP